MSLHDFPAPQPASVEIAVPAVPTAVRVLGAVLFPKQLQGHRVFASLLASTAKRDQSFICTYPALRAGLHGLRITGNCTRILGYGVSSMFQDRFRVLVKKKTEHVGCKFADFLRAELVRGTFETACEILKWHAGRHAW